MLEKRLENALQGEKLSPDDCLALADLCRLHKKRYHDAARLFDMAFAAKPKLEADVFKWHRYHAACAAALAAAGKGVGADELEGKEKSRLRQKALAWLEAELAVRRYFLLMTFMENPLVVARVQKDLQDWQDEPDLTGVRDNEELARLPADEQEVWQKFWTNVEALRNLARERKANR